MNDSASNLLRLVGIGFEFKRELGNFFTAVLANPTVSAYDSAPNTPTARAALLAAYNRTGPSMAFSTVENAYDLLAYVVEATEGDDDVSPEDSDELNSLVLSAARYVGMDEGDNEHFHFMVEAYKLARKLADVLTLVDGAITSLSLLTGGSGITTDGVTDTATGVVFTVETLRTSPSVNYEDASVEAEIDGGVIVAIESITGAGDGFLVDETVTLTVDTTAAGQASATQTTDATANVDAISDI